MRKALLALALALAVGILHPFAASTTDIVWAWTLSSAVGRGI